MKLNPFVIMREDIDGNGIVFDSDNNTVMTLNRTGVLLWRAFAQGSDLQTALRGLAEHFSGASEEQMKRDCEAFQAELLRRGLFSQE